jgi:hypothetical protein
VPPADDLKALVATQLSQHYDGLDDGFIRELSEPRQDAPQEAKPRITLFAKTGAEWVGLCVVSGKRGGAVKIAPIAGLDDPKVVGSLFDGAEETSRRHFEARKLYTVVPVNRKIYREELEKRGFEIEGLLIEPYRPGVDMLVYSRFPRWS